MPATIIGSAITSAGFGIPNSQTGMVVQSSSAAASSDAVELKNKDGDITAVCFRNKKTTHTIEGAYTTFSANIGASITIANGSAFGLGSFAAHVTEITRTRSADNFEQASFTAVRYDGIS